MPAAKAFHQPLTPAPYRSHAFREEELPDCSLNLFICPWQFSYAIIRSADHHLIFVQAIGIPREQQAHYVEFCMKIIVGHSLFGKTYQKVSFRFHAAVYYWMPEKFFSEQQLLDVASILKIENPYGETANFSAEKKPFILSKFPTDIFNLLKLRIPYATANHAFVRFLPHFTTQFESDKPALLFYFFTDSVDLILIREKNLRFCNHYSFQSMEEFELQVNAVMNFLGLDKNEVSFFIAGEISERSALVKSLSNLAGKLSFVPGSNDVSFESDYPFPGHYFQNLLC